MKINANSVKIGNVLNHNKELWTVIKLNHVKPGKGGAFIQAELKNIKDNRKLNERFRSNENLERVILDEKKGSFLYNKAEDYIFMDTENFEEVIINEQIIGDQINFLTNGMDKFTRDM